MCGIKEGFRKNIGSTRKLPKRDAIGRSSLVQEAFELWHKRAFAKVAINSLAPSLKNTLKLCETAASKKSDAVSALCMQETSTECRRVFAKNGNQKRHQETHI